MEPILLDLRCGWEKLRKQFAKRKNWVMVTYYRGKVHAIDHVITLLDEEK